MRYILKNPAPPAFEKWKKANNPSAWSDLMNEPLNREPDIVYYSKGELRGELLREQGHLCCYCQQRIKNVESTVIEHFYPRNGKDKELGRAKMFEYNNLLASCDGGSLANRDRESKTPSYPQYCDKSKGEKELSLSPLHPDVETRLSYLRLDNDFRIIPVDEDIDALSAIEEKMLNLNTPFLEKRRGEAVAGLIFNDEEMLEPISSEEASKVLDVFLQFQADRIEDLPEFFSVKLQFLKQFAQEA